MQAKKHIATALILIAIAAVAYAGSIGLGFKPAAQPTPAAMPTGQYSLSLQGLGIIVEPGTTVQVGEEVYFDGSSVTIPDAELLPNGMVEGSYEWDFGDDYTFKKGSQYMNSNLGGVGVTHFYMRSGTYTVALNVTDVTGKTATATTIITVEGQDLKLPPRASSETILELKFDGNLDETSGNELVAEWKNGQGSFVKGIEGQAADLTNGAYIEVLDYNGALSGMDELTISLWAKKKDADVVGYLLDKEGAYNIGLSFSWGHSSASGSTTTILGTNGASRWPADDTFNDEWHHYAFVYNGSIVRMFVDGIYFTQRDPALTGAVQTSANSLLIGKKSDEPDIFNGYIDEVKIYNKALTPEEIFTGFGLLHADFHGHTAQYIYAQIPGEFTKDPTNKINATITGDTGFSKVIYNKNDLQPEEKFLLNNSELPAGNYTLTVQLLDSESNLLDEIKEKFEKPYDDVPEFGIDESNAFRMNGELFFPVTPWALGEGAFGTWKNTYINLLESQSFWDAALRTGATTVTTWTNYLNQANTHDLKVIGPMRWQEDTLRLGFTRNSDPGQITEYVTATKDHNAMLMWMWTDEPIWRGVYGPVLRAWTYKTRALDPTRLVVTNYALSKWIAGPVEDRDLAHSTLRRMTADYKYNARWFGGKRTNVTDVISVDWYPIAYQDNDAGNPPSTVPVERVDGYALGLDRIIEENYNLVPVMTFVETCAFGDPAPPTPEQLKMLIWLNIVHGAKGISWFHQRCGSNPTTPKIFAVMEEFLDHITQLTPVVLGPETERVVTDNANIGGNRVDTMAREHEGNAYIFAVRLTEVYEADDPTIDVTFNIEGIDDAVAEAFDENRTINIANGQFQDTFAPNAVHIYKIALAPECTTDSECPGQICCNYICTDPACTATTGCLAEEQCIEPGTCNAQCQPITECVDTPALLNHISQWKQGQTTMLSLMQKIALWKTGTGCS